MRCCLFLLLLFMVPVEPAGAQTSEPGEAAGRVGESPTLHVAAGDRQQEEAKPVPWWERIRFGGDFRIRYEGYFQDDVETRHRTRFRLRLRMDAPVNDDLRVNVQLVSGDPSNPVSANQTFTSFFTLKPISIDRATLTYNPKAAPALTMGAGKFGSPQMRTQLLFDDELNVEGGWQQVAWSPVEKVRVRVGGLQTVLNEVSSGEDSFMLGVFGDVEAPVGAHMLRVAVADYAYANPDPIAVASATGALASVLTNAVRRSPEGAVVGFQSGFNVVDTIAEATLRVGGQSLRLLGEFAINTRAMSDRDNGAWIEAEYGDATDRGSWSALYTYGWLEQDVTPSAFMFSDVPGTNLRMHVVEASVVPLSGVNLDAVVHFTNRLVPVQPAVNPWLTRIHLVARVRF